MSFTSYSTPSMQCEEFQNPVDARQRTTVGTSAAASGEFGSMERYNQAMITAHVQSWMVDAGHGDAANPSSSVSVCDGGFGAY